MTLFMPHERPFTWERAAPLPDDTIMDHVLALADLLAPAIPETEEEAALFERVARGERR